MPHLDFEVAVQNLPFLIQGAVVSVQVALLGMALATALGLLVAIGRMYGGHWTDRLLALPVDLLRSIPLLALMVWVFYALPVLMNQEMSPFTAGVLSLGLQYGAFMSEVFRAGLGSVSPGQRQAGLALGMSNMQVLRRVIVPQAAVRMLPPAGSQLASLIKDTSLLYGIGVGELMHQAATVNGLNARPFEIFTVVGLIYLGITYPLMFVINWAYRRLSPLVAG